MKYSYTYIYEYIRYENSISIENIFLAQSRPSEELKKKKHAENEIKYATTTLFFFFSRLLIAPGPSVASARCTVNTHQTYMQLFSFISPLSSGNGDGFLIRTYSNSILTFFTPLDGSNCIVELAVFLMALYDTTVSATRLL